MRSLRLFIIKRLRDHPNDIIWIRADNSQRHFVEDFAKWNLTMTPTHMGNICILDGFQKEIHERTNTVMYCNAGSIDYSFFSWFRSNHPNKRLIVFSYLFPDLTMIEDGIHGSYLMPDNCTLADVIEDV